MLRLVEDIKTFVARGRGTRNLCGIGKIVEEDGRHRFRIQQMVATGAQPATTN